jgi:hypothetical protein
MPAFLLILGSVLPSLPPVRDSSELWFRTRKPIYCASAPPPAPQSARPTVEDRNDYRYVEPCAISAFIATVLGGCALIVVPTPGPLTRAHGGSRGVVHLVALTGTALRSVHIRHDK